MQTDAKQRNATQCNEKQCDCYAMRLQCSATQRNAIAIQFPETVGDWQGRSGDGAATGGGDGGHIDAQLLRQQ
eukprot:6784807-Pyramimonas_sp.AAC.1